MKRYTSSMTHVEDKCIYIYIWIVAVDECSPIESSSLYVPFSPFRGTYIARVVKLDDELPPAQADDNCGEGFEQDD